MIRLLVVSGKKAIHQLLCQLEHGNRVVVVLRQLRDDLQGMSAPPTI